MTTGGRSEPIRRLVRIEGLRRARANTGAGGPGPDAAIVRDVAVHDAVRRLGLVPATGFESGYDARDSGFRYRIAGCTSADLLLAPEAFRSGSWDRGLLVFMTLELEPLAIDELTLDDARAARSVSRVRERGRRRWSRR